MKRKDDKNHSKRCILDMVDYRSAWCNNAINVIQVCVSVICCCRKIRRKRIKYHHFVRCCCYFFSFKPYAIVVHNNFMYMYMWIFNRYQPALVSFSPFSLSLFCSVCVCHLTKIVEKKYICYRCPFVYGAYMSMCMRAWCMFVWYICIVWVPTCFHTVFFLFWIENFPAVVCVKRNGANRIDHSD